MRLLISLLLLSPISLCANAWLNLLSSVGLPAQAATLAEARDGGFLILEGASPQAEALGIHATARSIEVRGITDLRHPKLPIIWGGDWRSFRDGPHFELPRGAYP